MVLLSLVCNVILLFMRVILLYACDSSVSALFSFSYEIPMLVHDSLFVRGFPGSAWLSCLSCLCVVLLHGRAWFSIKCVTFLSECDSPVCACCALGAYNKQRKEPWHQGSGHRHLSRSYAYPMPEQLSESNVSEQCSLEMCSHQFSDLVCVGVDLSGSE
jgi:hypothetical protein